MAYGIFPVSFIKSKDLLQRLKKEGRYYVTGSKSVKMKEVENAILKDEALIEEFKNKISTDKFALFESIKKKHLEIKDTSEWKELLDAHNKLEEYERLCRIWTDMNCFEIDSYNALKETIEKYFVSKYKNIIANNVYNDFYNERYAMLHSEEANYIEHINDIRKNIEDLKEYCLNHPNEIKGVKKNR